MVNTVENCHDDHLVYENEHFRIEQCRDCPIPGYLIVIPKNQVRTLSAMKSEALAQLGRTLADATKAVEQIVNPERVYCARFGERDESVHFHLFPRTGWILEEYLKENPLETNDVNGPRLLAWARNRIRGDSDSSLPGPGLKETADKLRQIMEEGRRG